MAILKLTPNVPVYVSLRETRGALKDSPGGFGADYMWKVSARISGATSEAAMFYARPELNRVFEVLLDAGIIRPGVPFNLTKATDAAGKNIHYVLKHAGGIVDTATFDESTFQADAASVSAVPPQRSEPVVVSRTPAPAMPAIASGVNAPHLPNVADKAALYAQCYMEMLVGMRGLNGNGLSEGEIRQASTAVFIECGKNGIKVDRERVQVLKKLLMGKPQDQGCDDLTVKLVDA